MSEYEAKYKTTVSDHKKGEIVTPVDPFRLYIKKRNSDFPMLTRVFLI